VDPKSSNGKKRWFCGAAEIRIEGAGCAERSRFTSLSEAQSDVQPIVVPMDREVSEEEQQIAHLQLKRLLGI